MSRCLWHSHTVRRSRYIWTAKSITGGKRPEDVKSLQSQSRHQPATHVKHAKKGASTAILTSVELKDLEPSRSGRLETVDLTASLITRRIARVCWLPHKLDASEHVAPGLNCKAAHPPMKAGFSYAGRASTLVSPGQFRRSTRQHGPNTHGPNAHGAWGGETNSVTRLHHVNLPAKTQSCYDPCCCVIARLTDARPSFTKPECVCTGRKSSCILRHSMPFAWQKPPPASA